MSKPPFNSSRVKSRHLSHKGFTLLAPVFYARISVHLGMSRHTKTRQRRGLMLKTITLRSVFLACVLVGILFRKVRRRRNRQYRAWCRSLARKWFKPFSSPKKSPRRRR
ncbi:hypothetical protein EV401DRAFT_756824 [Pisolithus croceorrhizus]|nr:hypothetical protein EV401DRAFT_756824 [Pisolithus croceorrhizus]